MSFQNRRLRTNQKWSPLQIIIWVICVIAFIIFQQYSSFSSKSLIEEKTEIVITSEYSYDTLTSELGLNKYFFRMYREKHHSDFTIKKWKYILDKWENIEQVFESLNHPIFETKNVTLLEWWNIFDIDLHLSKQWVITKWDYIRYVENSEKIKALTEFFPFIKWSSSLEWYLYPDTYTIDPSQFAINKFVILQLETFEKKVYNKLFAGKGHISLENFQSVINLASIVEKEERNPKEKSTVAGILKKRLKEWWMIGADITVCYPYRLTSEECKMVVTKYLYKKTDYNTRQMTGLPKTAIWNPSYQTIEATLNHKNTSYYFYLHDTKTWKIYYAATNAGHERNKALYLR